MFSNSKTMSLKDCARGLTEGHCNNLSATQKNVLQLVSVAFMNENNLTR